MIQNLGKYAHPPKSGAKPEMKPRLPQVTPRSKQAQSMIAAPPAPFKNPAGIANAPAPGKLNQPMMAGQMGMRAPKMPAAGPVGGGKPKTMGMQVGMGNPKKVSGGFNKKARGGHSLLYGD